MPKQEELVEEYGVNVTVRKAVGVPEAKGLVTPIRRRATPRPRAHP
ncbi:hypothetical protein VSH64_36005 [Amycolatopsis rhabdoformis]|uniref:Uncharacterized protein n=1 Tax=Amycolatopsis rhabdoformis TaxID=1448059 RepID=A0ABZ1IQ66_9PSEU|nr:hypothetical protein [Amycolatopsis rhabdoformis]WSE35320.1 hypothetical protein VSH64_36005 [Amycolatopsis rhabdoformis]